jgi:hypothetical protein
MPIVGLLQKLPLWGVFLCTMVLVLASIEVGFRVGRVRGRRGEDAVQEPIGAMVGAVLGLLAFMLAFTFGITSSRFEARKSLLLDEVNAIGTAWLRAGLLSEPHRSDAQRLFREYVDIRVDLMQHPRHLRAVLARSDSIQGALWSHAVGLAHEDRSSEVYALFTESLNTVFDLQTSRVTVGIQYRIPDTIWVMLGLLTVVAMLAVGYQFGVAGRRGFTSGVVLAVAFSAVILLVADLDRAQEGSLRINQQPMLELQQKLHAGTP